MTWIVPTLHPAFMLRGAEHWHPIVARDLKLAADLQSRDPDWSEDGTIYFVRHAYEIDQLVRECRERGEPLSVDVENIGEHPLECSLRVIGIGHSGRAVVVHFLNAHGGRVHKNYKERAIRKALQRAFSSPTLGFLAHNGVTHDITVLEREGLGPVRGPIEDTMIAHHVGDSEMPHGLSFVTSMWTECSYYKDMISDPDLKGSDLWARIPDKVLGAYNAKDVLTCARARPGVLSKLTWQRGIDLYRREIDYNHELRRMSEAGLYIDQDKRREVHDRLLEVTERHLGRMRDLLGESSFNPRSVVQLRRALYSDLGFKPLSGEEHWTKEGKQPSTGKQTLFELSLRADADQLAFIRSCSAYKKADKLLGSYTGRVGACGEFISGPLILSDGCVHPTWRMLTISGRLACTPAVNTLPKPVKALYRAHEGNVFVGTDAQQAELRTIAEMMDVPSLQEVYRLGQDAHTVNAVRVFRVRPPVGYKQSTQDYLATIIDGYFDLPVDEGFEDGPRWLGKRGVFACSYQAGADTIYRALRADTDLKTGELLFPNLQLSQVMAFREAWRREQPEIPESAWALLKQIQRQRYYEDPISGRRIQYSGGVKLQDAANVRIQTAVTSVINEVQQRIRVRTDAAGLFPGTVVQVHDSIVLEVPEARAEEAAVILEEEFNKPVTYTHPVTGEERTLYLPADKPSIGLYLSEV